MNLIFKEGQIYLLMKAYFITDKFLMRIFLCLILSTQPKNESYSSIITLMTVF